MGKKDKSSKEKKSRASANQSKWKRGMAKTEAAGEGRIPQFPEEGTFDVTFERLEAPDPVPGKNEWCNAVFTLDGAEVIQLHCMSNKSLAASYPRLKSLCMAIVGCGSAEEYDEWDPNGDFFDALLGFDNDFSELVEQYAGKAQVRVRITNGGETNDGDWFRNANYSIPVEKKKSKKKSK